MEHSPRQPASGVDDSYAPPHSSLTEADATPARPGWAKAMGICHILIATVSSLFMLISMVWVAIIIGSTTTSGDKESVMMGLDNPRYVWFVMVDGVSGLILNGFTFASGLALVNLRAWGARMWGWLAPVKVGRLVVVWGWFVVGVAPALALGMGRAVAKMITLQAGGTKRMPTPQEMTLVYAWMFLAMGIGMIVLGSLYPAITWWLVRRRGIQAALIEAGPVAGSTALGGDTLGEVHPS